MSNGPWFMPGKKKFSQCPVAVFVAGLYVSTRTIVEATPTPKARRTCMVVWLKEAEEMVDAHPPSEVVPEIPPVPE